QTFFRLLFIADPTKSVPESETPVGSGAGTDHGSGAEEVHGDFAFRSSSYLRAAKAGRIHGDSAGTGGSNPPPGATDGGLRGGGSAACSGLFQPGRRPVRLYHAGGRARRRLCGGRQTRGSAPEAMGC